MRWRRSTTIVGLTLAAGILGAAVASADEPAKTAKKEGVIDPRAEQALKGMCTYLQSLKSLRADATTTDEKVSTTGQKIQEVKESRLTVMRPNAIAIDRTGPAGRVLFRYDGKRFSVYSVDKNVYASAPAPATIDAAIDEAGGRYGIDAPAGDLVASDAYKALLDGVTEGHYIGLEPVGGVLAHHIAMRKGDTDFQLWISDGPEPVPLRYVITSRDLPSAPQFTLELRNFEPNPPLSASSFTLIAPHGAQQAALRGPGSKM